MTNKNHLSKVVLFFFFPMLCALFIAGCHEKEETDKYGYVMLEDDSHINSNLDLPTPLLASGKILVVRLVYAVDENDKNSEERYKVILSRIGEKWSDSVQIQGLIRSKGNNYNDYSFGSQNFNWQIEKEQYGIETLEGDYEVIIQGSNGYENRYRLHWADNGWTNSSSTLTFSVP